MAVTRTSTGTFTSGISAITVTPGVGAAAGNFGIIAVETANQAVTTPTGWSVGFSGAGFGTAGAAGASRLTVFYKPSITSTDIAGVSIADSGDHQGAAFITYSGVDANGFGGGGGTQSSTATTSASTTNLGAAGLYPVGSAFLAIIGTDRDSATVSTNSAASWSNVTGSNSFIVNGSTASGAGGGLIINELITTGAQTGATGFSCSITSSAYNSVPLVLPAPASGTTVAPSTGHLTLGGKQASVVLGATVASAVGHLALGGKVPTVSQSVVTSVAPAKGHLALTGYQSAVLLAMNVSPAAGHLVLSGKQAAVTGATNVAVASGHLVASGKVPTIQTATAAQPTSGHLTLTGRTPALVYGYVIGPTIGHATHIGYQPGIASAFAVAPAAGHILLSGYQPTVSSALADIAPATGHLIFTGYAPDVSGPPVLPDFFPIKVLQRHRLRT